MSLMLKKKGGKVFAPKLPVRRPGAPSSTQSSARPSVERQSQTPVPHARPDTIAILNSDDDAADLTNDPTSGIINTAPHPPHLEKSQDIPPHAHTTRDASARNNSTHTQNRILPPDKELLKRKTRDHEAEVEVPPKRHQPSGLDAQRSPPKSTSNEESQTAESPSQVAPPSGAARLSTTQPIQHPSKPPQPPKAIPPARDDGPADKLSGGKTAESDESSQENSRLPEPAAALSNQQPLPESIRDGSASETPDPEPIIATLDRAGTTTGLGAAGDVGSSGVEGGQLAHTPIIVPMAPLNPDGTPGEVVQQPATGTKKRPPKRQKIQTAEDGDDIRATVEMQLNRPRRAASKKEPRKKKEGAKKSNKRAETPEGAEKEVIDKQAMTMADMCKDLRIGPKFSMHDELRQREKQKIIQAKVAKHPELAGLYEDAEEGGEEGDATAARGAAGSDAILSAVGMDGPQMRIIDGQIVVDENSMQINRHQIARAEQGEVEQITENEFTRIITCGTHMKRERAQLWDMAANEIFWKGLRMFGTDFEMIAGLFPNRTRRQIKLKFCKEEKDNPMKIDRILKGAGNSIELDTYEQLSGIKLEEVADIEAERERIEAEQQAEEDRRVAEQAEAERKKREEITAKATAASSTVNRVLATSDDSGDEADNIGDNSDSGEKENRPRQTQSRKPSQERLPGEKPQYVWTRKPQEVTAEQMRQARVNGETPVYPWSKAPTAGKASKTPKAPKQGGAKKKGKKPKGGADETVQVLGDA